ncbi:AI-2E family transporter [Patescibacteria group bacterium]|nr:AI-2E family transporter [Patescibacteria group bacterium]
MVPAILVGIASYGFKGLIVVLILYWIIQQSENNILVPMVMNRTLGISPLIIFISMIV